MAKKETKKTIKLKKFNVKKITSNEIVYRDGSNVVELFLSEYGHNGNKIISVSDSGNVYGHYINGKYMKGMETQFDLFFK